MGSASTAAAAMKCMPRQRTVYFRPSSHLQPLWSAGFGECCVCRQDLPPMDAINDDRHPDFPTVEHVIPRRPRNEHGARARALRKLVGPHVKALAHLRCNNRKSNRMPTGCELVFLQLVNARLYNPTPKRKRHKVGDIG